VAHEVAARELDYLRSTAFDALSYFVAAASVYFLFVMVVLCFTAPDSVLPWLLLQKGLYLGVLIRLVHKMRSGAIAHRHFSAVLTLVLGLCLTSSLITAATGLPARAGTYSVILLLGCALVEISYRWAIFHWALVWSAWMSVGFAGGHAAALEDFLKLVGVQMVALTAMSLRLRFYKAQFLTLQRLELALQESEKIRATLDRQVDSRTQQLTAAYEDLRLSVAERERIAQEGEKLHEQLLQSQKMESLGRLAGGVAHDFNNLLTVITGNIELARMEPLSADVDELLVGSSAAALRAAELTGQLLAFSRKQVMKIKPFKVQATLESSIKLVDRLLGEDVRLEVHLDCPEAIVDGDPSQIQQALLNLVVNARDAMPEGGTLSIDLVCRGHEVALSVKDTGHGIPLDIQSRIFEPFFTSKPMGRGTGLGLATVHGIVSKHNGRVEVESSPGQGARFRIILPVGSSQESEQESVSLLPVPPLAGSGRIMLVEDDHQVRNLAVRALRLSGYQVFAFECGQSALAALEESNFPDILVTDVVMPGMDGGRLAEAVRHRIPGLPVLFMSGYTDDRLSSFGIMRKDDCSFLAKPFVPAALQKAVADALRGQVKRLAS
jgi:signal transduction histidine kinase/CheY-like chemotaxis protein